MENTYLLLVDLFCYVTLVSRLVSDLFLFFCKLPWLICFYLKSVYKSLFFVFRLLLFFVVCFFGLQLQSKKECSVIWKITVHAYLLRLPVAHDSKSSVDILLIWLLWALHAYWVYHIASCRLAFRCLINCSNTWYVNKKTEATKKISLFLRQYHADSC